MIFYWTPEIQPFHVGGRYHIETSPLLCKANQWTGFYMISASVVKTLRVNFGRYPNFQVYDLKTFEQVHVIPTQGGSVYSLAVSREYIICGTYENTIHVRQLVCVYDMFALLVAFSEINVGIFSTQLSLCSVHSSRLIAKPTIKILRCSCGFLSKFNSLSRFCMQGLKSSHLEKWFPLFGHTANCLKTQNLK